jgi:NADPH-dependent 2,4-dienoyl-CoA reductase/sulfur reductase-like enzyme
MIAADNQESANLPSKSIEEPARQVPLYGEYEVVILGGGPAGIAAAAAAAMAWIFSFTRSAPAW